MKKIIAAAFLFSLISCGQNQQQKNTKEKIIHIDSATGKDTAPADTTEVLKHQTANKEITNLPIEIKLFIPEGYSAINATKGDLNLDKIPDVILVLRKQTEEITSNYDEGKPEKRPMVLLLGQADNTFKEAFKNNNAIPCIDCSGIGDDPFTGVTIKNGYFSIEEGVMGGAQHWQEIITFKFNKEKNNWFLYKDNLISYSRNETEDMDAEAMIKEPDRLKTVKDFGVIAFDKFIDESYKEHDYE